MRHAAAFRPAAMACVGGLLAVAVLTVGEQGEIGRLATVCVLGSAVALLCAGVFFYVHWHVGGDPSVAWLVTVISAFALQELNWFMLLTSGATGSADSVWCLAYQIVINVVLGTLLVRGGRLPVRRDPLALGMLIGLAMVLTRILVLQIPAPAPSSWTAALALSALGIVGLWNAVRVARARVLTAGLRVRVATTAVFLSIGQVTALPGSPSGVLVLSAVANVAGGALLLTTAAARARRAVADEAAALRVLRGRLETAQQGLHHDQARLHEIRATLAGISTATELLHHSGLSGPRREQLHEMTLAELRRLDHLVSERRASPPTPTELDATMRPVILRHQLNGLPVSWRPGGHVAVARPDDVAEIVNVLLSNARRHAGGAPVRVETHADGDRVTVSVVDRGPGIDPEVLPDLFTWGTRGRGSPGEGVGLAAARLLATELDGSLELEPHATGAGFVLSLPAVSCAVPQGVGR